MKKEWKELVLDVLDVNMTMLNTDGGATDADFATNTPRGDLTFS